MSEHNFLNQTSNFEINPPIAKDLLQQDFQSFNTTRQKGSSFHTKKDFKFKGNVNFQYNMPEIERVRFKSNNSRNKEDKENVLSGRKKIEGSNNSDQDDSMSVFSIDTESEFKLRKMSAKSIPKLSLKKSISIPRTSITSIFSGNKKKVNLQLSNQEDFKCIIAILRKQSFQRTDNEITLLKSAFSEVKFFEERKDELSEDCLNRLYRELKYEFFDRRSAVFNVGEMGRNFYIIIQGTVSILLKKKGLEQNPDEKFLHSNKHLLDDPSDNTEDREEILKNKKKKALLKKILAFEELTGEGLLKEQPIEISDDEYFNVRYSSFFIMRKMGNGESFGEIALRQNVPRTGTIVCNSECHFAILTRDSYQNILKYYDDQIINEKIDFLIRMPIFRGWSTSSMEQLFKQFKIETFRKDKVLYKEDEPSSFLYFIQEGEVELTKYIDLIAEITKKRNSLPKTERFLPGLRKEMVANRQRVSIGLLGRNEMFGQEEILKKSKRKTKAVCVSSKTTIFYIHKEAFFSFVKNYNTVNIMKSINNLNKDWHDSLTSSFRSFLQPLPSQEHSSLIPFLKNFHPRKSLSLSDPPSQAQQQNPLPQNINHHSLWSNKKIVSKEYNSHRKTFHGGHLNEFVHCFNDYYAKIESKLERSNSSLNFDQILINNPFAKHILDMKTKRGRVQKDYPGFGKYLTESLKKRIQEDYHNNSFFSMNFCQKVIHKKQNPWEKVLLEKIRGGERAKSLQREGEKKKEMIIINKITQTQYPSKEKNQNFLI